MCMACYEYLLILDGEDGVLTPVVVCVVCGAESLTGFDSVER